MVGWRFNYFDHWQVACHGIVGRGSQEEQNEKNYTRKTEQEGVLEWEDALEEKGGECMEVHRSAEMENRKLYRDQRRKMEWLEMEQLGGEL